MLSVSGPVVNKGGTFCPLMTHSRYSVDPNQRLPKQQPLPQPQQPSPQPPQQPSPTQPLPQTFGPQQPSPAQPPSINVEPTGPLTTPGLATIPGTIPLGEDEMPGVGTNTVDGFDATDDGEGGCRQEYGTAGGGGAARICAGAGMARI